MSKASNNKSIANFMGLVSINNGDTQAWFQVEDEYFLNTEFRYENQIEYTTSDMLPYKESWDWLMPVVEKIESLGYNTLISDFQTQISFNGKDNMQRNVVNIFSSEESSKIEEVYKAVVEFIGWYNKQKQ